MFPSAQAEMTEWRGRGGGVVVNKREGESVDRGEFRSKRWVENTNMI